MRTAPLTISDAITEKCLPNGLAAINAMALCPSLASFRFSPDANIDLGILNPDDEPLIVGDVKAPNPGGPLDFALPDYDDFNNQDFGGGAEDDDDVNEFGRTSAGEIDFFASDAGAQAIGESAPGYVYGQAEPLDPRRASGDVVMSMDGPRDQMFNYFDSRLTKNWAGPEHWKMRRFAPKKGSCSAGRTQ